MKFRTEIEITNLSSRLDYTSNILLLGSCFATSIGEKLHHAKFKAEVNPVGVLFNPMSICSTLNRFAEGCTVEVSELHQGRGGEWFHFDFHGSLSAISLDQAVENMNSAVVCGCKSLEASDTLIITLGTAWVYQLLDTGKVVANCHKEPQSRFERRALSVDEIVDMLSSQVEKYPSKRFIFTLSPIRHLSDGLAENALSKATLRVAISQIVERYSNAAYFPAFEIMMDDLRDYRFYAEDMLHPSKQAVEYIWSKFRDSYITDEANTKMDKVAQIVRAAAHRPFNEASSAHKEFCRKQLELIKKYEDVDFGEESAYFMGQLQNNL